MDPEPDMIALARERARRAGIAERVEFRVGYTADLSPPAAYRAWLAAAGLDPAALAKAEQRMAQEFHAVSEPRLAELLAQAGFGEPGRLYQALGYGAYQALLPA